ncbi:MAG: BLUF domain-containing protein [Pseudomonadota bacterium]
MHMIAYTSEFVEVAGDVDDVIADIITASKKNNANDNITGVLFFLDGHFLQIIEGEESDLRALTARIEDDKRHTNIKYLMDREEKERGFGQWKMDSIKLGKGQEFDAEHLEAITKSFEQVMVPSCDTLAHYYKTLLAERKRVLGIF